MSDPGKNDNREHLLRMIMESSTWFIEGSTGGAHTEVRRIDGDALAARLGPLAVGRRAREQVDAVAQEIAGRFLLKRGKIREFHMQLLGPRENAVPRSTISYAFGPVGYNLHPSLEKTRIDVADAVRQIPYWGAGNRDAQLAPDLLDVIRRTLGGEERDLAPTRADPFLVDLTNARANESIYDIAGRDPYFREPCAGWRDLHRIQQGIRKTPLSREMEDRLRKFFDAPITVGWRDVLRYAKGSRHPNLGWTAARDLISDAFGRWGEECFLLPEITYYAPDLEVSAEDLSMRRRHNEELVGALSEVLSGKLPRSVRCRLSDQETRILTWDLLEFHHDYPVYRIEPYQGLLSLSAVRMFGRASVSLASAFSGIRIPERRNLDLNLMMERPLLAAELLGDLKPREARKLLKAFEATLAQYQRRGAPGVPGRFERIGRTFYTFQERADFHAVSQGRVETVLSLEELWKPQNVQLLDEVPEIAEKLLVFFVLAYRYYVDTGFFPDMRPRNAGRDVFIYGIWGYLTDNILVMVHRRPDGGRSAEVRFVDNRDQFKEYRRQEDRDAPVGMAKTALRLTAQVTEPSMRRSIGIFADQIRKQRAGERESPKSFSEKMQSKGLDMLQAVAHDVVEQVFEGSRNVVDDVVDDLFEGVRQTGRKLERSGVLPGRDDTDQ
ncbi:MAG: hypothetical protein ABIK09_00295 [Pseudomonadota bacterium]